MDKTAGILDAIFFSPLHFCYQAHKDLKKWGRSARSRSLSRDSVFV